MRRRRDAKPVTLGKIGDALVAFRKPGRLGHLVAELAAEKLGRRRRRRTGKVRIG